MMTKEQFDMIVEEIKSKEMFMNIRFEPFDGRLIVKIDRQFYNKLIEFRKTLPIPTLDEAFENPSDGFFECKIDSKDNVSFDIEYINDNSKVEIVDNADYEYKIEFSYSISKPKQKEKQEIVIHNRRGIRN